MKNSFFNSKNPFTNKIKVVLIIFSVLLFGFSFVSVVEPTSYGQPGDHCGSDYDPPCRSDLDCIYNRCLAKPFANCNSWADCAGESTHLMGCFDNQCRGRHAYPCGSRRDDPVCAPGFYCHTSHTFGYNYCVQPEVIVRPPTVITKPAIITY